MAAAAKHVLLEDGGHGTVPFVVGSEQRAIHGYPIIMAIRSSLMAATDWSSQMLEADHSHRLLAEQCLTDEQWKLFQCLWLYAHGDDKAFEGVTASDAASDQLRGYLGIDDCSELRRATKRPLVLDEEISRMEAIFRSVVRQVASLDDEDQQYAAVTALDEAWQSRVQPLYQEMTSAVSTVAELNFPLVNQYNEQLNDTHWNFRGQLAQYMPSYIRQWVNETSVDWEYARREIEPPIDRIYFSADHDISEAYATVYVIDADIAGESVWDADFLVPESILLQDDFEYTVSGAARGMLNRIEFDLASMTHAFGAPVRGEAEWNELVAELKTPILIAAELAHEFARMGAKMRACVNAVSLQGAIDRPRSWTDQDAETAWNHKARQRIEVLAHAINSD